MTLNVKFAETNHVLNVKFAESVQTLPVKFAEYQRIVSTKDAESYVGEYTVTPTEKTQVLETVGKLMSGDVTVHAIPKEYGRVSYDNRKIIKIT